jgi:chromosome segregation ATPase
MSLLSAKLLRGICSTQFRRSSQIKGKVESAVAYYNDVIGITEVTKAKSDVISCETNLSDAQLQRRHKQFELRKLQGRLKDIHSELDRTPRGDDRYLHLITEEHAAIKKEQGLLDEFEVLENKEREAFHELSNKVRVSHEKEREREERTKYWSVTASLIGALLGIIGATISNEVRMRNLRKMIPMSEDVRTLFDEIAQIMHSEQKQITEFITEMKTIFRLDSPKLGELKLKEPDGPIQNYLSEIKKQNAEIAKQLEELKRLTALDQALDKDPNTVVYVGDDMELLLKKTEENIESKMKLQTLLTVVVAYGVVALTLPLLYIWFNREI